MIQQRNYWPNDLFFEMKVCILCVYRYACVLSYLLDNRLYFTRDESMRNVRFSIDASLKRSDPFSSLFSSSWYQFIKALPMKPFGPSEHRFYSLGTQIWISLMSETRHSLAERPNLNGHHRRRPFNRWKSTTLTLVIYHLALHEWECLLLVWNVVHRRFASFSYDARGRSLRTHRTISF